MKIALEISDVVVIKALEQLANSEKSGKEMEFNFSALMALVKDILPMLINYLKNKDNAEVVAEFFRNPASVINHVVPHTPAQKPEVPENEPSDKEPEDKNLED
ncbi:MAG: hypothetical protein II956_13385 [Bacteroidales bacterium]|nr:hypothetical protein [Bacteroidales bacterium]